MLVLPFSNFVNALQDLFFFLMRHYQLKIDEKIPERKFPNWALEWSLSLFRVILMYF